VKPANVVPRDNGFGRELKKEGNYVHEGVNGNGVVAVGGGESVSQIGTAHMEEEDLVDSQMTDVR
jgi:hypothetical protein